MEELVSSQVFLAQIGPRKNKICPELSGNELS
jgi:hypothetical protein